MRSIALAALIVAATPVDAAACHHYSRWFFPWPQRCSQVTLSRLRALPNQERPANKAGPDIPLPFLTRNDCEGGEADELTRARLLLRAAMEAR